MPKILLNPFRNNLSISGIVLRHDELLDQPVTSTSDVIFNSLAVGNLTASGNITFTGNVTEVDTEHLLVKDNIIDINADNENPLMLGGFRVQRGPGLTPFDILYNESQRLLKIGMGEGNMRAVATREDVPTDGWMAVWNEAQARFDTSDKLTVPLRLQEDLTLHKALSFGSDRVQAPILQRVGSNLHVSTPNGDVVFPSIESRETAVRIPFNKRLDLEQSSMKADVTGTGIRVNTESLSFSHEAAGRVQWEGINAVTAYIVGSEGALLAEGSSIVLKAQDRLSIEGPEIVHGVARFSTEPDAVYRMSSQGDFVFSSDRATGTVDVPRLSFGGRKGTVSADDVGNLSVNSSGELFLSPSTSVILNQGKTLTFAGSRFTLSMIGKDVNVANADGGINLFATTRVALPSGCRLAIGDREGAIVSEDDKGAAVFSSTRGDILFKPGPGKSVRLAVATALTLGDQPIYGTSTGDIVMNPSGLIRLAGTLGVVIPVNVPLLFGSGSGSRVYRDAAGDLRMDNDRSIVFTGGDGVSFAGAGGLRIGSGGGRVYQDADTGDLTMIAGGSSSVKIASSLSAGSDASATDAGTAAIVSIGGIYVGKNLIVKRTAQFQERASVGDTLILDAQGTVPLRISNASDTNGVAIGLSSRWDATPGFTIGRGDPLRAGGRGMVFTIPPFAHYGIAPRPSFSFGSSRGDTYLEISDRETTVNGSMSIRSTLSVSGRGTFSSMHSTNLSAADGAFNVTSVSAGSSGTIAKAVVNGGIALSHEFGELSISSADALEDPVVSMRSSGVKVAVPTTVLSSFSCVSLASFSGAVRITGGSLDMSLGRVTNLSLPIAESDACNRLYVDSVARGNTAKQAVTAATNENVDLSVPIGTIDDVTVATGERVLVKAQDDPVENGLYVVSQNRTLQRTADLASGNNATGSAVFVTSGTLNGTTGFVVVGNNPIVGTDPIVWTPNSGASMIKAGPGIIKTGNSFSVQTDNISVGTDPSGNVHVLDSFFDRGITVYHHPNGTIRKAQTSSDQSHVTRLGTVTVGEWQAGTIGVTKGGTGASNLQANSLLTGAGTDAVVANEGLFYSAAQGRLGIGTRDPLADLHLIGRTGTGTGTWLRIEDAPVASGARPDNGLIIATSGGSSSRLAQRDDGALLIGQDNLTSASQIHLLTQQVRRVLIDADGNVVIGSRNLPFADCQLSVTGGSIGASGDLRLGGHVRFSNAENATIAADAAEDGTLRLSAPVVNVTGELRLAEGSSFNMRGFEIITDSMGGNDVFSSGPGGVARALRFKLGSPDSAPGLLPSATILHDSLLVPKLQIGGTENDKTTGFIVQPKSDGRLEVAPGTLGRSVSFRGPVQMADSLMFVAGSETEKALHMYMEGQTLYVQPPLLTGQDLGGSYAGHNIIFGSGTQDLITTFGNRDLSGFVRYDPVTVTQKHPGGVFSVSSSVLADLAGGIRVGDAVQFATGNAAEGVLSAIGWYYLGPLGAGRTILSVPGSWTLRIDYDGRNPYVTTLFALETTGLTAFLQIYRGTQGDYHMFLKTTAAPCRFSVFQSPTILSVNTYEGGGVAPSGEVSAFVPEFVLDYDLATSQANASMECGSLSVLGRARMNNASLGGTTRMAGEMIVTGQAQFTAPRHLFLDPYTTLRGVTISHDRTQAGALHNSLTVHGSANVGSTASICLGKGVAGPDEGIPALETSTAALTLIPDDGGDNAGALEIRHSGQDITSKILLSTRAKPRLLIDQNGRLIVNEADDFTTSLDVHGSAKLHKDLTVQNLISTPELRFGTGPAATILTGDEDGNLVLASARLRGLSPPVHPDDAATRGFVETMIQGLSPKESVAAATIAGHPLDLSGVVTVLDGVLLTPGQRILVKDNTPVDNGIYIVQYSAPPIRSDDMAVGSDASATFVFVSSGDVNASSGWVCATRVNHATVGVNDLIFTQFSGAGHIMPGTGLEKSGNQLRVIYDGRSIEAGPDRALRVSSHIAGVGLSGGSGLPLSVSSVAHLESFGIIRGGTWNADIIGMRWGGTGVSSLAAGRIPFSNGLALSQGKLFFDEVNVRLGVNTTTPTSGLTVEDRDVQVVSTTALSASPLGVSSPAASSALLFTAVAANRTYAFRNTGADLVLSAGTGSTKLGLTDIATFDVAGSLSLKRELGTRAINLGPVEGTTATRWDSDGITRTVAGPLIWNMYAADHSGASISFYGALGAAGDKTNSESMRIGFYNGSYIIGTSGTGTGASRDMTFQTGGNVDQMLLKADGSVLQSGPLTLSSTLQSLSDTSGGALTVMGGAAFAGTVRARGLNVTGRDTTTDAFTVEGSTSLHRLTIRAAGVAPASSYNQQTSAFALECDAQFGTLTSTSDGKDSLLDLSTGAGDNSGIVGHRAFGFGSNAAESNEGMFTGFDPVSQCYEVKTFKHGAGANRALTLSASGAPSNQLRLSPDGSVLYGGHVYHEGRLSVTNGQEATSSLSAAALTVTGGVAIAKSVHVGIALQAPQVRVTASTQYSNAGSLDAVSVAYSAMGELNMFNHPATSLNIHTGVSQGPYALLSQQEKLVLGHRAEYAGNAHVILSTRSQLILSSGTASRILTLVDGSSAGTNSNPARGAIINGTLTCDSASIAGNALIGGDSEVKGAHTIGRSGLGRLLTLRGAGSEFSFISKTNRELTLKSSGIFSISRSDDDTSVFSIDSAVDGTSTLTCPLLIRSSASTPILQLNSAAGNRMFSFDVSEHVLDVAGGRVVNSASPLLAGDLCNKGYVDNLVKGLNLKAAVTAAADNNVDLLRPIFMVDNVALSVGSRILLMGQVNPVENGIYTVGQANYLTRSSDLALNSRAAGAFTFVQQGEFKGDKGYVCIADYPYDIVGQHGLRFSQFNGNMISAGIGLYKDGNNVMNIALASGGSGLSFDADRLRVDPSLAGRGLTMTNGILDLDPITELSDVVVGRYMASVIDIPFGGTGNDGFVRDSIIYSVGSKLVGDVARLAWNPEAVAMGINGPVDVNAAGDGLTIHEKDLFLAGSMPAIAFGSAEGFYSWRMRRQETVQLGNVRDVPSGPWLSVAFSADGTVGVVQGEPGAPVYVTTNGGWQFDLVDDLSRRGQVSWGETTLSLDGSVIVTCGLQDYLYVSRDSGATFTRQLVDERRGWEWTDMSADGQYMLASSIGTGAFRSSDTGATWQAVPETIAPDAPGIIGFVHVTRAAAIQYIGYWGGGILESRDHGQTFTEVAALPRCQWWDLIETPESGILMAYACPGFIYISEDGGLTWQVKGSDDPPRAWNSVSISNDGKVIAGTEENGRAYLSTDRGVTFRMIFSDEARAWRFISVAQDGSAVFAGGRHIPVVGINVINGEPSDEFPVSTGNVDSYSAYLSDRSVLFYSDKDRRVQRYAHIASSTFIVSGGRGRAKGDLEDLIVLTTDKQVGIGYTATNAADISATLDVAGSMQVTGPIQIDIPLATVSGGTGTKDLPYGMLIAGGYSKPFMSTGHFPDGGVPVGDINGEIRILSGIELREKLGVAAGTHLQAYSENLEAISGMTPASGTFIVGDGSAFKAITSSEVSNLLTLGALARLDTIDDRNWTSGGRQLTLANGGTGATGYTVGAFLFSDGTQFTHGCLIDDRKDDRPESAAGVRIDGRLTISNYVNNQSGHSDLALLGNSSIILGKEDPDAAGFDWQLARDLSTNEFVIKGTANTQGSFGVDALTDRLRISLDGTVTIQSLAAQEGMTVEGAAGLVVTGPASIGSLSVSLDSQFANSLQVNGAFASVGSASFSDTVYIAGNLEAASRITAKGEIVIERDTAVGPCASGMTVATDRGGIYSPNTRVTDEMRHLSVVTNISDACTVISLRNLQLPATGRGWDIIANGDTNAPGNKLIFQSAPSAAASPGILPKACLTLDAFTGDLEVDGAGGFVGSVTAGGFIAAGGDVSSTGSMISLQPTDQALTPKVRLSVAGKQAEMSLAPSGALGLEASGGALSLKAGGGKGLLIAESTGDVTADGKLLLSSPQDATSYTDGGALTVRGGAAVAGSAYIKGDLMVSGVITGETAAVDGTLVTSAADMVNVSELTVHSCRVITTSNQIMLTATFMVTPTEGSLNTVFTFSLPKRTTLLASRLDLDTAQCSGFSDDVNLIVLQNILCTGVPGETKALVQFQSVDTSLHYLQVFVSYRSG